MMDISVVYAIVAFLGAWAIDLAIACTGQPVMLAPILKLVIVLACLIVVLISLGRHRWLMTPF